MNSEIYVMILTDLDYCFIAFIYDQSDKTVIKII